MCRRSRSARTLLFSAVAAFLWSAQLAAAGSQYIVISVEPKSEQLPPGKIFEPSDVLNIPAGTVVTLLGEDGTINSINGPATFIVTEDQPKAGGSNGKKDEETSKLGLIADLLIHERQRTGLLGVSRSTIHSSKPSEVENPWAIPIVESGPACIRRSELVLRRQNADQDLVFSVRFDDQESVHGLVWTAGAETYLLPCPDSLKAATVTFQAGGKHTLLQIKRLPAVEEFKNPTNILVWLLANGCERQALTMVNVLAKGANRTSFDARTDD